MQEYGILCGQCIIFICMFLICMDNGKYIPEAYNIYDEVLKNN